MSCWGKVIAGTRGIRAQYARVEALWLSDRVPDRLADAVAARYPSVAILADRDELLAGYPPTPLECYEPAPTPTPAPSAGLRIVMALALVAGLLPAARLWPGHGARIVWGIELVSFLAAATALLLTRKQDRAPGPLLGCGAIALWLAAPFGGLAGLMLLRLAVIQVALLGLVQRLLINREARRFPAPIPGFGRPLGDDLGRG